MSKESFWIRYGLIVGTVGVALWLAVGLLTAVPHAGAAELGGSECTVEVTGDNTTDYVSSNAGALQTAVNNASVGALIKVAGTCAGLQTTGGTVQTLYIDTSVTIQGGYTNTNWLAAPDPQTYPTTLSALDGGRVVYITSDINVTLAGLTIADGHLINGDNVGINGAGIRNDGTLTLINSRVVDSFASDGQGGGNGGGLFSTGVMTITNSTIANNTAEYGGGIYNSFGATLWMADSTLSGNHGIAEAGGIDLEESEVTMINSTISGNTSNHGAGINLFGMTSSMVLIQSTVADNTAVQGAGIFVFDGAITLSGVVLDNNGSNCNTAVVTAGYNVASDSSCSLIGTGDVSDAMLVLGPLADNGGTTQTHDLLPFSEALDHIPTGVQGCGSTLTKDQRGLVRPVDGACDAGAVEVQVNYAPVAQGDGYSGAEGTPITVGLPGVLGNDGDGDWDGLTAVLDSNVLTGTLNFPGNGSFTFIPPTPDWFGDASFTYHATDGTDNSAVVTVMLHLDNINDAPVAVADSYTAIEDTPLSVPAPGVLSNDSDVEGDPLTAFLNTNVNNGSLTFNNDGSFMYTPNPNYCGSDSFAYYAHDGQVGSNIVSVSLDIACINDAPVVNAGEDVTAVEGEAIAFNGSYSDPGFGGDSIQWVFGDGAVITGTLTPSHAYADNGTYTVTLTITDSVGAAGSDGLVVTVDNAAPVLADIGDLTTTESVTVTFTAAYTDAGLLDTHTATIAWGDGTTEPATVANGLVSSSHVYASAGVYTAVVTLTDNDNGVGTQTFTVTVEATAVVYTRFLPLVLRP